MIRCDSRGVTWHFACDTCDTLKNLGNLRVTAVTTPSHVTPCDGRIPYCHIRHTGIYTCDGCDGPCDGDRRDKRKSTFRVERLESVESHTLASNQFHQTQSDGKHPS